MAKRATATRIDRLEQLKGLLAAADHATIGDLADELGVSGRTLSRDVALLRRTGLPIEADPGRGGGVRLAPGWRTGRVQFDRAEAIDLLLSLAIAERFGSPLFLGHLAAIRRKVAAAFADRPGLRIRDLRRRILVGGGASAAVLSGYAHPPRAAVAAVAEGFFDQRMLDLDYVDGSGVASARRIEPQALLYNPPVWYLIAWDHLRGGVRSFRIDRVRAATLRPERFRLRPPAEFVAAADIGADPL